MNVTSELSNRENYVLELFRAILRKDYRVGGWDTKSIGSTAKFDRVGSVAFIKLLIDMIKEFN